MIPFATESQVTAAIPDTVLHLVRGGLIAYPTETVYGLGSGTGKQAVADLSALKGREPGKPFLLLVSDLEMLGVVNLRLTDAADRFASAFWPGPLTLVLPGGEGVLPDTLRGPEGGVAVRWTSHAATARLIATLGSPVTSTSANLPRKPPALDAQQVQRDFGEQERAGTLRILDAGPLAPSAPSTVVDCTGPAPRVIRHGAVTADQLRAIIPAVILA